jgi:succinate-semialdehyde dehydrogenase/glutarate-semialdehyde dehydrogenase
MLISGKFADSSGKQTISVINPATGGLVDTVPDAAREDVELAVQCARRGQIEWAAKALHERIAVLARYAALVEKNKNEIAKLLSDEMGKPIREALMSAGMIARQFEGFIEVANHMYGKVHPRGAYPGREADVQMVVREPLGVVAAIIPFNAPLDLYSQKAAPILIAGNALIVKPSSDAPLATAKVASLLIEAGVPENAVQIVTGRGSTVGFWLSSSPDIDGIFFTGSTETGVAISKAAAANLTECFLELGGNDPFMVFEDGNVDLAAREAVSGRTINAGQICASPKRMIVHKRRAREFTDKLLEEVKNVRLGTREDINGGMGCLISENAAKNVEAQVNLTVSQGAELLYGGRRDGAFYSPTVLGGVTRDMDIARDMEVFGPVFPIIEADSDEDAVAIANSSVYGLSSAIFTEDIRKGIRFAGLVQAGGCVINGHGFYMTPDQPFGGVKMSGKGREGMDITLREVTVEKTVTLRDVYHSPGAAAAHRFHTLADASAKDGRQNAAPTGALSTVP